MAAPDFSGMAGDLRDMALSFAAVEASTATINSSIQTFREFSAQITLANAVAHGTADQFNQMSQAAQNFALSSKASIMDVSSALYFLNSAGYSTAQSLAAMTSIVQLAQSTMTDFGQAAQLVTTSISAFGLSSNDAARVSNLFVAAAHDSQATITKLSFAMRQVGPVAAEMNVSIEDTVTYLDLLYNAGMSGQQAGTALRNVMVRMADPVGEGGKLFKALGVSIYDSSGQMRTFQTIMKDLSGQNIDLAEATALVGRQSAAGFLTMLKGLQDVKDASGNVSSAFDEQRNRIANTNEAYRQAVAQMNTLDGAMTRAAHSGTELKLMLGEALAPTLANTANGFADWVRQMKDADTQTKANTASTIIMVAGGAAFLLTLGKTLPAIGTAITGYKTLAASLEEIAFAQQAVAGGAGTLAEGLVLSGEAATAAGVGFTAMTSAVFPFLALVAVIGAVSVALWKVKEARDAADLSSFSKDFYRSKENNDPGSMGHARDTVDPITGKHTQGAAFHSGDLSADRNKVPADLDRALREIPDQYPVGMDASNKPTGFANRATAYQTNIELIQDQIDINHRQIQDMDKLIASKKELQAAFSKLKDPAMSGGAGEELYGAIAGGTANVSKDYVTALKKLSEANYNTMKEASRTFYSDMASAISNNGSLTSEGKQAALENARKTAEALAGAPKEVLEQYLPVIAKAAAELDNGDGFKATQELKGLGDKLASNAKTLGDQARQNNAKLAATLSSAKSAAASELPQVKAELIAYGNQTGKGNKELADLMAAVSKADPKIWDDAMRDVDYNFNNLDTFIKALADEARKRGIQSGNLLKQQLSSGFLPIIDQETLRADLAKSQLKEQEAEFNLARTEGKAISDARGKLMGDAFQLAEGTDSTAAVVQELKAARGQLDLTTNKDFQNAYMGLVKRTLTGAMPDPKDVESAVASAKANGVNGAEDVRTAIQTGLNNARATYLQKLGQVEGYQKRTDRAGATAQHKEDVDIARSLNLPSESEFKEQMDALDTANKFFKADWLNDPLGKLQQNLEVETNKGSKLIADFRQKYTKLIEDNILKGTALVKDTHIRDVLDTGNMDASTLGDLYKYMESKIGGGAEGDAKRASLKTVLDRMEQEAPRLALQAANGVAKARAAVNEALADKSGEANARGVKNSLDIVNTMIASLDSSPTPDIEKITTFNVARATLVAQQSGRATIEALRKATDDQLKAAGSGEGVEALIKNPWAQTTQAIRDIVAAYQTNKTAAEQAAQASLTFAKSPLGDLLLQQQALQAIVKVYKEIGDAQVFATQNSYGSGMAKYRLDDLNYRGGKGQLGYDDVNKNTYAQANNDVISGKQTEAIVDADRRREAISSTFAALKLAANNNQELLAQYNKTEKAELDKVDASLKEGMQSIAKDWDTFTAQIKQRIAILKAEASNAGDTTSPMNLGRNLAGGMQAGVMNSIVSAPTAFETGMQAASKAVEGFSDLATKMALGFKMNFRQAAVSILVDIDQMIMKMLIMKAASVVMQHIPGLGGGTGAAAPNPMNGLAEAIQQHTNTMLMHTAALGLSTASTGLNTAALALQTAAASLQASGASSGASAAAMAEYGGAVGMTSYAGGGTHWASASDLRSGGVKQPGQTTMAMFGEGHMPEAFIPMMDRRTVQMETLPNGDLHIPLPSGGSIPVSMRNNGYQAARKYADGGTSIGEAHVTAAGNEAMNNGGSRATTNQQHVNVRMGDQTTHISIDHKGDAKEDDVRAMTQKLTEHVNNIMDSRENAMMLKMIKQGGALSPTSTVGGFGGLGR